MACIEAWWVTAAFAAISCFGGTSPTGRNWSLLAGTRKNRQSMRTDVFFEATPSESFVEGTPFRQRAEIGDVVAQIERRLGCASDESSAYSPTPMFGLDPHGSHQGAYCGRSSRSQEIMSVDPRYRPPSWATRPKGSALSFSISCMWSVTCSSGWPAPCHQALQIRSATVAQKAG